MNLITLIQTYSNADMSAFALLAGLGVGAMIVYFGILALTLISMWKIFEKAGKPGWAAIVPIYNLVVLLEIVNKPIWWIVLFLIPVVNFVIMIIVIHQLSLSFGKEIGFTIGLILLTVIFIPILAFSDAKYVRGKDANEDMLETL